MRSLLLAAALAAAVPAGVACAQSKVVVPFKPQIVEVGVYEVLGAAVQRPAPGTASGTATEHEDLRLIQVGTNVKATRGTTFGFRYVLTEIPDGPVPGLQMRALHPPMRGPDGRVSSSSSIATETFAAGGEARGDIAYILSEPFEVLRGDWELQLLYMGRVILSQRFKLQ